MPVDGTQSRAWSVWAPSIKAAAIATAGLWAAVEVVGLIAKYGAAAPQAVWANPTAIFTLFEYSDANWFVRIVTQGYLPATSGGVQYGIVDKTFPPGYPLSIRLVSTVLHISPVLAGVIISVACTFLLFTALHRLAALEFDNSVAVRAVVCMAIFPSAFFLVIAYADAMVVSLMVWSFYSARTRRWILAGVLAGLACLVKVQVVVIVIPLAVEYMSFVGWKWRQIRPPLLAMLTLTVAGLGVWMTYLAIAYGDPVLFVSGQGDLNRSFSFPGTSIVNLVSLLFQSFSTWEAAWVAMFDLVCVALYGALLVFARRRLRPSYTVLAVVLLLVNISTQTLSSTARYMLQVFPLYLMGALLMRRSKWLQWGIPIALLPIWVYLVVRFANGLSVV